MGFWRWLSAKWNYPFIYRAFKFSRRAFAHGFVLLLYFRALRHLPFKRWTLRPFRWRRLWIPTGNYLFDRLELEFNNVRGTFCSSQRTSLLLYLERCWLTTRSSPFVTRRLFFFEDRLLIKQLLLDFLGFLSCDFLNCLCNASLDNDVSNKVDHVICKVELNWLLKVLVSNP